MRVSCMFYDRSWIIFSIDLIILGGELSNVKKQHIEKDLRCPDYSYDEYKKESSDPAVIRFVAE